MIDVVVGGEIVLKSIILKAVIYVNGVAKYLTHLSIMQSSSTPLQTLTSVINS